MFVVSCGGSDSDSLEKNDSLENLQDGGQDSSEDQAVGTDSGGTDQFEVPPFSENEQAVEELVVEEVVDEEVVDEEKLAEPESKSSMSATHQQSAEEAIDPDNSAKKIPLSPERKPITSNDTAQVDSGNSLLLITLVVLSITTFISIAVSFWLYRWRRVLLGDLKALAPEEFADYVKSLNGSVVEYSEAVAHRLTQVGQEVGRLQGVTENMVQTFMSLQDSIDKKDQEIARYKSGYDTKIFKQFIHRFLRIDRLIEDYLLDSSDELKEVLTDMQAVLEDALDDCGVEKFEPEIGAQYIKTEGVADRPRQLETDDPEKLGLISKVIDRGYRLRAGDSSEIILPAKVEIFTSTNKGI